MGYRPFLQMKKLRLSKLPSITQPGRGWPCACAAGSRAPSSPLITAMMIVTTAAPTQTALPTHQVPPKALYKTSCHWSCSKRRSMVAPTLPATAHSGHSQSPSPASKEPGAPGLRPRPEAHHWLWCHRSTLPTGRRLALQPLELLPGPWNRPRPPHSAPCALGGSRSPQRWRQRQQRSEPLQLLRGLSGRGWQAHGRDSSPTARRAGDAQEGRGQVCPSEQEQRSRQLGKRLLYTLRTQEAGVNGWGEAGGAQVGGLGQVEQLLNPGLLAFHSNLEGRLHATPSTAEGAEAPGNCPRSHPQGQTKQDLNSGLANCRLRALGHHLSSQAKGSAKPGRRNPLCSRGPHLCLSAKCVPGAGHCRGPDSQTDI